LCDKNKLFCLFKEKLHPANKLIYKLVYFACTMYIAEGRGVDKLKIIARLIFLVFFTVLYTVHCHELLFRNSDGERAVQ
jgi:hypothetical protein